MTGTPIDREETEREERAVREHARLVSSLASRFLYSGKEFEDLYQVGMVGLLRAVRTFDESRGLAFSTYAVPVILGEIKRYLRDDGAIHAGRGLKEKYRILQKADRELSVLLGRSPTLSELSSETGLSREEILQATEANAEVLSLEAPVGDGTLTVADSVPDSRTPDPTDLLALKDGLSRLSGEERKIITLRYVYSKTQQQAGEMLGMTQVQISRKEKKILEKLRKEFE